ncbi:hypothetical protein M011DRAFT_466254 [Sporormia fimetaria CBS 119925]|uniref:Tetraspanin Tsp3 n=1 Tax=Sporormia fimetaria CBS 119925 TaxID=1340428 RepID=A0A6A6VH62_9PLEO|nr:hypothetical protein M011DRAFT_466254 [Sporormia fimetaria CBS 119925]
MAYTRKQIVTCISIVYLVLVTALAAYAGSRAQQLSLPISDVLIGFVEALPIIAGLVLEVGYDGTRHQERRRKLPKGDTRGPPLVIVANTVIFIYSTAVMTLLGTHVGPVPGLRCGLEERWTQMFRLKKEEPIRTIQDAFKCCGLINSHDRAWPFPDKTHDQHACEKTFGRTSGCLVPWRQEEQRMAGIMMAAVGLVFLWQLGIIVTSTRQDTGLHRVLPDRVSNLIADGEAGNGRSRRAIDYLPNFSEYRDDVAEEVQDDEDEDAGTDPQRLLGESEEPGKGLLGGAVGGQTQRAPAVENEWARN